MVPIVDSVFVFVYHLRGLLSPRCSTLGGITYGRSKPLVYKLWAQGERSRYELYAS